MTALLQERPKTEYRSGIEFFVPGLPAPGGSKKAFYIKKLGRAVITEDCKRSKPWRESVQAFALQAYGGDPLEGPLGMSITFVMLRPKGHFRTNGTLKDSAPKYPTTKPDCTKLTRSTEDALKNLMWGDDSQVVQQDICKTYGVRPGALIRVWKITA